MKPLSDRLKDVLLGDESVATLNGEAYEIVREAFDLARRVEGSPTGEIVSCDLNSNQRPTWCVMDDRNEVPLNEPKRVAIVPIPGSK